MDSLITHGIVTEIFKERERQQADEKYDHAHDDTHVNGELADAAISFVRPKLAKIFWPWDMREFKIKGNRENLIKAAALLIAEIERLDRDLEPEKELV